MPFDSAVARLPEFGSTPNTTFNYRHIRDGFLFCFRFRGRVVIDLALNHTLFQSTPLDGVQFVFVGVGASAGAVEVELPLHLVALSVAVIDGLRGSVLDAFPLRIVIHDNLSFELYYVEDGAT